MLVYMEVCPGDSPDRAILFDCIPLPFLAYVYVVIAAAWFAILVLRDLFLPFRFNGAGTAYI